MKSKEMSYNKGKYPLSRPNNKLFESIDFVF